MTNGFAAKPSDITGERARLDIINLTTATSKLMI
jgi:hypothetical protein